MNNTPKVPQEPVESPEEKDPVIAVAYEIFSKPEDKEKGIKGLIYFKGATHEIPLIPMLRPTMTENELIRLSKELSIKIATAVGSIVIYENRHLVEKTEG